MPGVPAKTDELGTAESHGGKREKAISTDHNKRTGELGPGRVQMILLLKCVTAGINDPAIIPSFSFLCASDSCGKGDANGARGNAPHLAIITM